MLGVSRHHRVRKDTPGSAAATTSPGLRGSTAAGLISHSAFPSQTTQDCSFRPASSSLGAQEQETCLRRQGAGCFVTATDRSAGQGRGHTLTAHQPRLLQGPASAMGTGVCDPPRRPGVGPRVDLADSMSEAVVSLLRTSMPASQPAL